MKYNPFRPNSIAGPGTFAGRTNELDKIIGTLFQTKHGNPQHFMIRGERGVGKTSLLLALELLAQGEVVDPQAGKFNFIAVGIELQPKTDYTGIITKIGKELSRQLDRMGVVKTKLKQVWEFAKRWEVGGVKYNDAGKGDVDPNDLLEELSATFAKVLHDAGGEIDGILITIDEADKPPRKSNLGEFLKLFTERLTKMKCDKVCIGLAGQLSLRRKLRESHESSPRIFEDMLLKPLKEGERAKVVMKGIEDANLKNAEKTTATEEAISVIGRMSEGYPHFIQQFAFSAFDEDEDDEIGVDDVIVGAYSPKGALYQLGVNYFEELYWEKINSDEYRQVLRAMAEDGARWVSKSKLRQKTTLKESTLSNAIGALKRRGCVAVKEGKKGVYRLPNRSFATWMKAFTERPSEFAEGRVSDTLLDDE